VTTALRRTAAASSLVLGAVLAGCSSAPPAAQQALSDPARTQLQMDVLAVSRAVAAHNTAGARLAIADLEHDLTALRNSNAVSAERATQIQQIVNQLLGQLQVKPTTSAPRTTTAPRTTAAPPPKPAPVKPKPGPPHHHDHGHGDG
jgi:hypothetical protein